MSYLEINNISFSYGEVQILSKVDFKLPKGKCLGIVGKSGAGKSTLAHIVSGHITPSQGSIILDGHEVTNTPSKNIFLIHQDANLFPWLPALKQVEFVLKSLKKDTKLAEDILGRVGLTGAEDKYPHELSGGMKQRLSLARGLAVSPKIFVFDEPFSSLDMDTKKELYSDFKLILKESSSSFILISHDETDINTLADYKYTLQDSNFISI